MDYEQKYEEVLGRVKELLDSAKNQGHIIVRVEDIENAFPEIQESEDERIRKEILNVFNQLDEGTTICGRNYDYAKWIAWLEKQGEKFQYWKPSEEQLEALDYAYNSCPDTERGNYYEGVLETIIDELHKLSEKQGEQDSPVDINKMVDEFAHTEVKDYGVPSMIEVDAYRKGIEDVLEKQNKQNFDYEHADIPQKDFAPIEPKFKVRD